MSTTALRITRNVGPSAIGPLRREATSAVAETGVDDAIVAAIRLCVSEALTNATMHAYSGESGLVEVAVELEGEEVVVTVRDEGLGLGGAADHSRNEGGLGLALIGKLSDGFRMSSESRRGTEIRMAFSRDADASSAVRLLSRDVPPQGERR